MKAFLLAAGLGTRLKPITDNIPKCLVEISGRPLLAWWINLFEQHGIDEVLINLHHLPDKVKEFVKYYPCNVKFSFFYEKELLGSARTIRENIDFVKDEKDFFVCYADNLTNYNLTEFYKFHKNMGNMASISLFKTDAPTTKGIVELDVALKVISFEEKPVDPKSNLANAGIYVFTPKVLELIRLKNITDIGYDLLPKLVNKMGGWITNDYLIDIGTYKHLMQAQNDWKLIIGE